VIGRFGTPIFMGIFPGGIDYGVDRMDDFRANFGENPHIHLKLQHLSYK